LAYKTYALQTNDVKFQFSNACIIEVYLATKSVWYSIAALMKAMFMFLKHNQISA